MPKIYHQRNNLYIQSAGKFFHPSYGKYRVNFIRETNPMGLFEILMIIDSENGNFSAERFCGIHLYEDLNRDEWKELIKKWECLSLIERCRYVNKALDNTVEGEVRSSAEMDKHVGLDFPERKRHLGRKRALKSRSKNLGPNQMLLEF